MLLHQHPRGQHVRHLLLPLEIQGCINFCQNERVNSIYEPPMFDGLELMKTW